MSDLERTAHHEAGHAVAFHLFGRDVSLVTIRPTDDYLGCCAGPKPGTCVAMDPHVPAHAKEPAERAEIEGEIVALLAGSIAGAAFWPESRAVRAEPCETAAEAAVLALPSRQRELLAALEATDRTDSPDDASKALRLAGMYVGESQGMAYLSWLRHVARDFVAAHAASIHAVAEALLSRSVLTGEEVAAIVKGTR